MFENNKRRNEICEKYNISKRDYNNAGFQKTDEEYIAMYCSNENLRIAADLVAKYSDFDIADALYKLIYAKEIYEIPYEYFLTKRLFEDPSDENLEKYEKIREKERKNKIEKLQFITGWNDKETKAFLRRMSKKFNADLATVVTHQLFKMNDEEIKEFLREKNENYRNRVNQILEETGWTEYQYKFHRKECLFRYGLKEFQFYFNLKCWRYSFDILDTFAVTGDGSKFGRKYNSGAKNILADKIAFDQTFAKYINRKFWVNKDTSLDEFEDFIDGLDIVFCKPINLHSGYGCFRYNLDSNPEEMYDYLTDQPLLLVEEIPKQHHAINEIYDKSINTIRITTLLKDGEFHSFMSWMKFGGKGSVVDGRAGGGVMAPVDEVTGIISGPAIDIDNNRYTHHPDTGTKITGFQIPFWKEALELTEAALREVDGINFVGWDVAITETGPVIIEGNSGPGFASYQMLFEGPENGKKYKYADLL